MEDITAVLFCGGRGTRLYPVTDYYQKVMMPLGESGRPMLEYVIRWLHHMGINKFIALIRYRANQIRRYFGDGSKFDVSIEYILDDPNYSGTGGALLNASEYIDTDDILIYFTDILSNFNIHEMYRVHKKHDKIGTAMIDPSWDISEGIIRTENHSVKEIHFTPNGEIYANSGLSLLKNDIFEMMEDRREVFGNNIDLSGDIFPILSETNNMFAYISDCWWVDVGSLSRHQQINQELLEVKFGDIFE